MSILVEKIFYGNQICLLPVRNKLQRRAFNEFDNFVYQVLFYVTLLSIVTVRSITFSPHTAVSQK